MKLELKHILPYLAYNPKAVLSNEGKFNLDSEYPNEHQNKICTITSFGFSGKDIYGSMKVDSVNYSFDFESLSEISICLRPLSDLTKEIEVNGEKFVPIINTIKKLSLYDLSECVFEYEPYDEKDGCYVNAVYKGSLIDSITFDGNMFRCMYNDGSYCFYNPQHEALDLLSEYHFDWKYRLIESGLAIDINTLNNQS